jgi:hypothetical protein
MDFAISRAENHLLSRSVPSNLGRPFTKKHLTSAGPLVNTTNDSHAVSLLLDPLRPVLLSRF